MKLDRDALLHAFRGVRNTTERLAEPLTAEDQMMQSMPACSPTKWHRAHTTWFFETFVLGPRGMAPFEPRWGTLFNSYYVAIGPRHARPQRGLLSRPTLEEIGDYRRFVDARVTDLITQLDEPALATLAPTITLGIAHEEQHQELVLTDILNALSLNPLQPRYRLPRRRTCPPSTAARFVPFEGGLRGIGAPDSDAFHFDNEAPRHAVHVAPFELADRLVTIGQWKAFDDAGGYRRPELWLSEGFDWAQAHDVRGPLYARRDGDTVFQFGLEGERALADDDPLVHVSYYEADAIARFFDARLPTEAEWEVAATPHAITGNLLDDDDLPRPATGAAALSQLFGDAWEWTQSAYAPYPGYRTPPGALGEYNGKFMVNQMVLRGGSCFTPRRHIRASYRNFWHPDTRFQMSGLRLARDLGGAA